MSRRCRGHKERRRCSVQILDNFWDKRFVYKLLIELANKLRRSMHRRCLRDYYSFVFNNPPFSPFLRVTLLQTLNTSGKPYHSKILKTSKQVACYKENSCGYVILSSFAINLLTCQLVDSSTYLVTLSSFAINLLTCPLVDSSTYLVTLSLFAVDMSLRN